MSWWFKIDLWKRVMLGLVLGLLVGLGLRYGLAEEQAKAAAMNFKPFGDAFMNLIRMLVVPLIFTTLVAGVLAMGDPKKLGSLGGRTIGIYMVTTLFAVTIGLIVGTIIQPGAGYDLSSVSAQDMEQTMARLEDRQRSGRERGKGSGVDGCINNRRREDIVARTAGHRR